MPVTYDDAATTYDEALVTYDGVDSRTPGEETPVAVQVGSRNRGWDERTISVRARFELRVVVKVRLSLGMDRRFSEDEELLAIGV